MGGFIKYLMATSKLLPEEEAIALIDAKLKELINQELDACINIVNAPEAEWGETSIRVNFLTRFIKSEILRRKQ